MEGLCPSCGHVRLIVSGTGSRFLLCRLSQSDSRIAKYPPQPVLACRGYQAERIEINPMNPQVIANFPAAWMAAWNSHNLETILAHYAEEVLYRSPFVAQLQENSSGQLVGKEALGPYFEVALLRFPELRFVLRRVFTGIDSLVIEYESVQGLLAAETFVLNELGQATHVFCHYSDGASP